MTTAFSQLTSPLTKKDMEDFKNEMDTQTPESEEDDSATLDTTNSQNPDPVPSSDDIAYKKRYDDLKRHYDGEVPKTRKERDAALKEIKELKAKLEAQSVKPYAPAEAVDHFIKENGDIAPILQELSSRVTEDKVTAAVAKIREELEDKERQRSESIITIQKLTAAHPDWPALNESNTDEGKMLAAWIEKKGRAVKRMAKSEDVEDVIAMLDLFKAEVRPVKKPSGTTKTQLSQSVSTNSQIDEPGVKNQLVYKDWEKKFDAAQRMSKLNVMQRLMDDLDLAQKEGRLIS